MMLPALLDLRRCHPLRGALAVLASLFAAILLAHLPEDHPAPLIVFPALTAFAGAADTLRAVRPRWNMYHFGILLLLIMDVMSLALILFLLFYPYTPWAQPHT
jgi:hypothetical protein